MPSTTAVSNEDKVIASFHRHGVDTMLTLPCDKIRRFLSQLYAEKGFKFVPLDKEEDGVGIAAGIHLGGGKPLMIIQSSGLGNSLNALLSLSVTYQLPLPILASWRGIYKEAMAAQLPFSKTLDKALDAWNIPYKTILEDNELGRLDEVIEGAYKQKTPYVALVSPKIWNDESFVPGTSFPPRAHESNWNLKRTIKEPELTRFEAIQAIAGAMKNQVIVSNIGYASRELFAAKDRDLNFYMTGSFGQASPIGLGVALASPRDTVVLDGDGSLLCTHILSTIASQKPGNLFIFCLDNGTFATTGDQITNAYSKINIEAYARALGIENTIMVQNRAELDAAIKDLTGGPKLIRVIVKPGNAQVGTISLQPVAIKDRFMKALGA